ncbi:MAG: hypothetical protein Q7J10_01635 [Methanosarcinaceae archaeon]|nr:hypothetical protein [Methanosarcinaceae archaeon]
MTDPCMNYDDFEIFDLKIMLYSEKPMSVEVEEPIPVYYLQ